MTTDRSAQVFRAPAKLNLFLHVVGRRADGYHLLQSAMRLIDLEDDVRIAVRDDGRIERARELPGIATDDDLTVRAARALQAASGTPLGASIDVTKRIPLGGGLGGGSSDAATTLLALNHLWRLGWSRARLAELGVSLGADVPFFIGGGDAFVEGIGERLVPMTLPEAHYAVVHPGVAVPTVAIFTAPELTRNTEALKISDFSKSVSAESVAGHAAMASGRQPSFGNDLEVVAVARFGAVREALAWLAQDREGARGPARMSGSGACVFRAFGHERQAQGAIDRLPGAWRGWSVRSLATHPHRDFAED